MTAVSLDTINTIAGIVVSVLTSISIIGGFFWWLRRLDLARLTRMEAENERVERESRLAIEAANARARIVEDELRRSIEAHKLYAAETFVTEKAMADAVRPLSDSIDRLTDRFDRLFELLRPAPGPRTR